jgi:hypothetical protein
VIQERTGREIRTIDICALEATVAYGKLVVYWIVEDTFGGVLYIRLGMISTGNCKQIDVVLVGNTKIDMKNRYRARSVI